jgi:hypothetical protein
MVISPPRGQEIPKGQDVEWGYAFDVHLNAFFPLLMILHLFQLAFLHCKSFGLPFVLKNFTSGHVLLPFLDQTIINLGISSQIYYV